MTSACDARFGTVPGLQLRQLDDDWVVYSGLPPRICELDIFEAAVLDVLEGEGQALTSSEIANAIAAVLEESDGSALVGRVDAALQWMRVDGFVALADS